MNKSDLVVLGFLSRKDMYGYEIIQWLKTHHLDKWADVKMPSVYKAMQRLEKNEQIAGKAVTEGNNPPRKVYSITNTGRDLLLKLQHHYLSKGGDSKAFWLGISFMGGGFEQTEFISLLDTRLQKSEEHIRFHQQMHEELKKSKNWTHIPFFIKTLMKMGERMHKEDVRSLKELRIEAEKTENLNYFRQEGKE
jgi:DNA-binding PadR family transcriptional regulator